MNLVVLDRVRLSAGAALQFIDAASGEPVREGLRCELRALADGARIAISARTASGVHHWPGLAARWLARPSPVQPARAELLVSDTHARFLPLRLDWPPPAGPGDAPGSVLLCSAPGRTAPAGAATLHALLADGAGRPAAWARVVLATADGRSVPGMSDAQGRLTLHLPFPRPERRAGAGSPPASPPGSPPSAPPWPVATVTLAFHHAHGVAHEASTSGAPRLALWTAQPECRALAHVDGTSLGPQRVAAAEPLVLRTEGDPSRSSDLRLVPL